MTQPKPSVYRNLPANERQEFRLPALLKEHLAQAAAQVGESLATYITDTLAERVTRDIAAATDWTLTVDQQAALMKILVSANPPTPHARAAATRADELFGPVD